MVNSVFAFCPEAQPPQTGWSLPEGLLQLPVALPQGPAGHGAGGTARCWGDGTVRLARPAAHISPFSPETPGFPLDS